MDATTLIVGVIVSSCGVGYFIYGRKQAKILPMLSGVGLCVVPYLISDLAILVMVSIVLMSAPFIIRDF